ncbi:MAG TPA: STAS domain-containing protein [Solirubrobacteraceae bacterium]|nr:STAS domain-containing protein [Solirubrobacteraceae bacterium]
MAVDDLSDAPAAERRVVAPVQAGWVELRPERDRVRVRCGGALDDHAAVELRQECEGLFERGFQRVIIDLSHTSSLGPAAVGAIAALNHRARGLGVRLSVVPGGAGIASTLRRAGLLGQLQLEGPTEVFLDWTR